MYKVHNQNQSALARQARLGFVILGIAAVFIICFMATQAIMTLVYGYDFNHSRAYQDVISKTDQAAEQMQGYMIDSYVLNIKSEICPTLKNITSEAECMRI